MTHRAIPQGMARLNYFSPMNIAQQIQAEHDLRAHFREGGLQNDQRTTDLYIQAHGLYEDAEPRIEDVEQWAWYTLNAPLFTSGNQKQS